MKTLLILAAALLIAGRPAAAQDTTAEKDHIALDQALPQGAKPYNNVQLIEVTYGPGGSSAPHRHECPVVGYVVRGTFRSKSGDNPEATYTAGQTFYEAPNALHAVSANASKKVPVTIVVAFICNKP